jgi:flavorubredoxin
MNDATTAAVVSKPKPSVKDHIPGSTLKRHNPLPREIAPDVYWLGECLEQRYKGVIYHSYNAAFLVIGETASLVVETGHPKDFPHIERQLQELLKGRAPLKYLFITHQETPHSGGLGRIMSRYPESVLVGDVSDYHLVIPQFADRIRPMQRDEVIDLGGRGFQAVEPVIRDLRTSWWGFETRDRVLFPGDGFAYSHYHQDGHCGLFAEEAISLDLPDVSSTFADLALFWTKFADMERYVERLQWLLDKLDVQVIAPTHGLPIRDMDKTVKKVGEGLIWASQAPEAGIL